jgi:hypothetical protein
MPYQNNETQRIVFHSTHQTVIVSSFSAILSLIVVLELPILNNKLIDMSTDGVRVRVFSFCVVEYLLVSCDLSYYNLLR